MNELFDLYQEIILDHNKRPRNFGKPENCTHGAHGNNPLCGDELAVYLKINDGVIEDVGFEGQGCAISKASASLMTVGVKGKSVEAAKSEIARVKELFMGEEDGPAPLEEYGDLASLSGVRRFPARIKCATLAWHALEAAVEGKEEVSTE